MSCQFIIKPRLIGANVIEPPPEFGQVRLAVDDAIGDGPELGIVRQLCPVVVRPNPTFVSPGAK